MVGSRCCEGQDHPLRNGPRQSHSPRAQSLRHVQLEGSLSTCRHCITRASRQSKWPQMRLGRLRGRRERSQHWEIRRRTRIHSRKQFELPKHMFRCVQWRSRFSWNEPGSERAQAVVDRVREQKCPDWSSTVAPCCCSAFSPS